MKYKVFILATLFLLFTDCTSNTDTFTDRISGNYSGTFERNGVSTPIQITFDNGTFNGQSAVEKFPAICNGIYKKNQLYKCNVKLVPNHQQFSKRWLYRGQIDKIVKHEIKKQDIEDPFSD